jgi:beta-lactamase superfamily II metal-dependent hydrolase
MPKATDSSIRIRMYRVGFGDCFLVTFPTRRGPKHVLVDCGVHARGDVGTIQKAVENIAEVTDRRLALVIAAHAHQDHISGFGKFAAQFRKFRIGEVWMSWTEDQQNRKAAKLKQKHKAAIARLQMYFASLPPAAQQRAGDVAQAISNLAGNESALEQLHNGFGVGSKVSYWKAGSSASAPGGILGLDARILGPPDDPDFLARMDPPPSQHYLTAKTGDGAAAHPPFAAKWFQDDVVLEYPLSKREVAVVQKYAEEPPDALAFALDQAINNTSLVVLFSFGGKYLLFPGDAQYGNWQYWLQGEDSRRILSEIDFLKVSHHGSLNATPKQAIDNMGGGSFAAMVSTQDKPWPSIPRPPLMEAIRKRTRNRMVRSDSLELKPPAPKGPVIDRMPAGFTKGDVWFDYSIPI